jgi:hypothetical protein
MEYSMFMFNNDAETDHQKRWVEMMYMLDILGRTDVVELMAKKTSIPPITSIGRLILSDGTFIRSLEHLSEKMMKMLFIHYMSS